MYYLYIRVVILGVLSRYASKYCAHIRSVLINGMCNFKDRIGAATAATAPSVGLDVKYENAWHCVAQAATQAKWHNKRNGASYVSTECCPPPRGHRGFPKRGNGDRENT